MFSVKSVRSIRTHQALGIIFRIISVTFLVVATIELAQIAMYYGPSLFGWTFNESLTRSLAAPFSWLVLSLLCGRIATLESRVVAQSRELLSVRADVRS